MDGKALLAAAVAAAVTFMAVRDGGGGREGRQPGQYQMVTDGHAIFRLNTSTGEVVVCTPTRGDPVEVTCALERAERARLWEMARQAERR